MRDETRLLLAATLEKQAAETRGGKPDVEMGGTDGAELEEALGALSNGTNGNLIEAIRKAFKGKGEYQETPINLGPFSDTPTFDEEQAEETRQQEQARRKKAEQATGQIKEALQAAADQIPPEVLATISQTLEQNIPLAIPNPGSPGRQKQEGSSSNQQGATSEEPKAWDPGMVTEKLLKAAEGADQSFLDRIRALVVKANAEEESETSPGQPAKVARRG